MATCAKCGGLMAEPGRVYGWGGKFCHCHLGKNPITDYYQEKQQWQPKITPKFILDQCEKMSLEEVKALIVLLTAYYDCAVLSAHPGGFKKREPNE